MNHTHMRLTQRIKHKTPIGVILCFLLACIYNSTLLSSNNRTENTTPSSQPPKKVELKKADIMLRNNTQIIELQNNVELYHDGATMYCDTAFLDDVNNKFEALGNIRILQGDSIELKGDFLFYDASTKLLRMRQNVVLEDKKALTTLFTDSLNFDRVANIAYYFDGGMVVDTINELTSIWGQYEPNIKLATFKDSVKLINPEYTIKSDTLQYSTLSGVASILGPATVQADSGTIYTSNGWYNTRTEESMLLDRSLVVNSQHTQFITGDTIYYNRTSATADIYGDMVIQDTIRHITLKGNRGHYNTQTNYAWATDKAQAIEYSQGDSLFLHADSLKFIYVDSVKQTLLAYHNMRFYRTDIQGVGDSLQYNSIDSTLHIYRNAILWSTTHQLSGDSIRLKMVDSLTRKITLQSKAYVIDKIDSIKYNQLNGRLIDALMRGNELQHVYVNGNVQSIFFPQEKDSTFIGLNRTKSGFLSIDFEDGKIKKLKLWGEPQATITPLPEVTQEDLLLKGAQWNDSIRPASPTDIFRVIPIATPQNTTPLRLRGSNNEQE